MMLGVRFSRSLFVAAAAAAAFALAGCMSTGSTMTTDQGMGVTKPPMKADASGMAKDASGMTTDASGMATPAMMAMDPMKSPRAVIDRFSAAAGHLQVRDGMNMLPGPNQSVNFDTPPFVTTGLGPNGQTVMYYNFDVQSTTPATLYLLVRRGDGMAVSGQLPIFDAIPGNPGYNDFWQVTNVVVPDGYVANSVGSLKALVDAGYPMEKTDTIVNRPIVPEGSTARHRLQGSDIGLHQGWYRNMIVFNFSFTEAPLSTTAGGGVPVSPIYVAFNKNPDQPKGGPMSGFRTVMGSMQTHNVVATLPGDEGYSPLWLVSPYDNT
ncbi:MAG: hypothetical protein ABSG63_20495, partial [Spirochaetia bacterium]